jgi:hypothetical protein
MLIASKCGFGCFKSDAPDVSQFYCFVGNDEEDSGSLEDITIFQGAAPFVLVAL